MVAVNPSPRTRQLDIEQDIYDFLKQVGELGESPSSILRRLLSIPKDTAGRSAEKMRSGTAGSADHATAVASDAVVAHLQSEAYRFLRNATDRYLSLLSAAYHADPEAFKSVLSISGYSRLYFAKSAAEIEKSGTSTSPKRIYGSPYFALTNADTNTKITMIRQVLQRLGFSKETVDAASRTIR